MQEMVTNYLSQPANQFFRGNQSSLDCSLLVATTNSLLVDKSSVHGFASKHDFPASTISLFGQIDFFKNFTALPRYAPSYGLLSLISLIKAVSNGKFPIEYIDLFALGVNGHRSCNAQVVDEFDDGKMLVRFGSAEDKFQRILLDKKPRVVGINCFTSAHHNDAVNTARIVKETTKGWTVPPTVIVGGSHATVLDEYFVGHEYFDIVVRGEGEITFLELLAAIYQNTPLAEINGITYKEGNRIIRNPNRLLLNAAAIQSLPWISREDIPIIEGEEVTSYYGMWHQGWLEEGQKVTDIQASRGCITNALQCRHCLSGHIYGKIRRRSNDDLLKEMAYLAEQNYSIVSDITDQVLFPLPDFMDFCKGMVAEGLNRKLTMLTPNGLFINTLACLSKSDKRLMVQSGYRDLCISIEGGPQYVSQVLNKPICVDLVEDVLRDFKSVSEDLKIPVIIRAFFMVGGPRCKNEYLEESKMMAADLVAKGLVDQVIPFIATPLPGTSFFDETIELIRGILSNGKSEAKMGHLFPNGNPQKKIYYRELFSSGHENDVYRFFENNYIWPRLRYGMADLHSIYGLEPKYILETTAFLANLTPQMPRIG